MLKFTSFLIVCLFLGSLNLQAKSVEDLNAEINIEMCNALNHTFSFDNANCTYCANGLKKNETTGKCEGLLSVYGKCNANDHFHAATNECMYCANGYIFDEGLRHCVLIKEDLAKN